MRTGHRPDTPRCSLGKLIPSTINTEAVKMMAGTIAASLLFRQTIRASTGWSGKSLNRSERDSMDVDSQIPREADRVLRIWGNYKRNEGGVVALGYPRHSAGFASGGASTEDSFQELVDRADRRTGAVADAILDEMSRDGTHARHVLAIWNMYLGDVARFRGDPSQMLADGCTVFLIEARRRGIAV